MRHRLLFWLILLLLMTTAIAGLRGGLPLVRDGATHQIQALGFLELAYGVGGFLGGLGLLWRRRWALPAVAVWGAAGTTAAFVAPLLFTPRVVWSGVILGGVGAAAIAIGVAWYVWRYLKSAASASPTDVSSGYGG